MRRAHIVAVAAFLLLVAAVDPVTSRPQQAIRYRDDDSCHNDFNKPDSGNNIDNCPIDNNDRKHRHDNDDS